MPRTCRSELVVKTEVFFFGCFCLNSNIVLLYLHQAGITCLKLMRRWTTTPQKNYPKTRLPADREWRWWNVLGCWRTFGCHGVSWVLLGDVCECVLNMRVSGYLPEGVLRQVDVCQEIMIVVMLHVAHMESFLRVLDVFVVLLEWLVSKRVVKWL